MIRIRLKLNKIISAADIKSAALISLVILNCQLFFL